METGKVDVTNELPVDDNVALQQSTGTNEGSSAEGENDTIAVPVATVIDKPLPRAPELLFANSTEESKLYWDRSHYSSPESQLKALAESSTLYIGNLAFSTRSHNVLSHFSQIGPVRKVVMGMDRYQHTPCGFGFVEYVHRSDAMLAVSNLSSTKLDGRIIRVELDAGFQPGRQYGRGKSGGQVRDDKRKGSGLIDQQRSNKRRRTSSFTQKWEPPEKVQREGSNAPGASSSFHDDKNLDESSDAVVNATQQQDAILEGHDEAISSRFRDES